MFLNTAGHFKNVFRGSSVLVTGATGFKGTWLSLWLAMLGAKVTGYSAYLPSKPCMFSVCGMKKNMKHIKGDIRDINSLRRVFKSNSFDFVFHLAAQPLVIMSYEDPRKTYETNILGTVNILECLRRSPGTKAAVIVTSDKCYKNMGWHWGYRESDVLGGNDPYSASKAAAEIIFHSYAKSFFDDKSGLCRIVSVRAGNVIGGGDWARDRIIPDCVRAWSRNKTVYIRNSEAVRPWQHVLEPLSGYLWLASELSRSDRLNGESFNFGPYHKVNERESVDMLIKVFAEHFNAKTSKYIKKKSSVAEEMLILRVSCDKALDLLGWHAVLSFIETVKMTGEWYREYYYSKNRNMLDFSVIQINNYVQKAIERRMAWTRS